MRNGRFTAWPRTQCVRVLATTRRRAFSKNEFCEVSVAVKDCECIEHPRSGTRKRQICLTYEPPRRRVRARLRPTRYALEDARRAPSNAPRFTCRRDRPHLPGGSQVGPDTDADMADMQNGDAEL